MRQGGLAQQVVGKIAADLFVTRVIRVRRRLGVLDDERAFSAQGRWKTSCVLPGLLGLP